MRRITAQLRFGKLATIPMWQKQRKFMVSFCWVRIRLMPESSNIKRRLRKRNTVFDPDTGTYWWGGTRVIVPVSEVFKKFKCVQFQSNFWSFSRCLQVLLQCNWNDIAWYFQKSTTEKQQLIILGKATHRLLPKHTTSELQWPCASHFSRGSSVCSCF